MVCAKTVLPFPLWSNSRRGLCENPPSRMTRRLILRPRAERDIQSAFQWYESQRPSLGDEFLVSLRERLETVRSFPEADIRVIEQDILRMLAEVTGAAER